MTNKAFLPLVLAALVLGGGLGGILIATLPSGGGESTVTASASMLPGPINAPGAVFQGSGVLMQSGLGEVGPEDLSALRRQLGEQGQIPTGPDSPAGGERMGVIESLEGGALTLDTPIGPLQAKVGEGTSITIFTETEGTLDDLMAGLQVVITVEPNQDGSMQTRSVIVLPEETGLPLGGPFGPPQR